MTTPPKPKRKGRELAYLRTFLPDDDQWIADRLADIRADRSGFVCARRHSRNAYKRGRRNASATERIRNAVSARMWAALKGRSDGALFSRLGYTETELVSHLEARFEPGMTWGNYGRWHVDHKRPCSSFDLLDTAQFSQCWGLDNLQPLWAEDNLRKGATYAGA